MATGLSNQLTRQVGEHLVTAELGRRGIIGTPFSGNVPDADILAYANRKTTHIQVKTARTGKVFLDVRKYLDIEITKEGQEVKGKKREVDRKLIIVCLFLDEVAEKDDARKDEFYIFRQGWLQDHLLKTYPGRKPPLNINSFHYALQKQDVKKHIINWDLIKKELGILR